MIKNKYNSNKHYIVFDIENILLTNKQLTHTEAIHMALNFYTRLLEKEITYYLICSEFRGELVHNAILSHKSSVKYDYKIYITKDGKGEENDDRFLIYLSLLILEEGKNLTILSDDGFISAVKSINDLSKNPIAAKDFITKNDFVVKKLKKTYLQRLRKVWHNANFRTCKEGWIRSKQTNLFRK